MDISKEPPPHPADHNLHEELRPDHQARPHLEFSKGKPLHHPTITADWTFYAKLCPVHQVRLHPKMFRPEHRTLCQSGIYL